MFKLCGIFNRFCLNVTSRAIAVVYQPPIVHIDMPGKPDIGSIFRLFDVSVGLLIVILL